MNKLPFYIVDVFAEKKYAGNQLAVFRNAAGLASDEMQRLAREIHFSETTFILSDTPRDGGFDVRIFTPGWLALICTVLFGQTKSTTYSLQATCYNTTNKWRCGRSVKENSGLLLPLSFLFLFACSIFVNLA